jgi:hypothetical protein
MRINREVWKKLRAFESIDPFGRYVVVGSILAITLDLLALFLVALVLTAFGVDHGPLWSSPRRLTFISTVILAPLFETFVLVGFIALLSKLIHKPLVVAIISAVAWGLIHMI